jgi:hypothetical protein
MSYDNLSSISEDFCNFISSLLVKRGGSLSFLTVFTFAIPELLHLIWRKEGYFTVLVMEIGWTDVGSGGYILVSCAHSNTSFLLFDF